MESVEQWRWRFKYLENHWEPREQLETHILDGSLFNRYGYNTELCMKDIKK